MVLQHMELQPELTDETKPGLRQDYGIIKPNSKTWLKQGSQVSKYTPGFNQWPVLFDAYRKKQSITLNKTESTSTN